MHNLYTLSIKIRNDLFKLSSFLKVGDITSIKHMIDIIKNDVDKLPLFNSDVDNAMRLYVEFNGTTVSNSLFNMNFIIDKHVELEPSEWLYLGNEFLNSFTTITAKIYSFYKDMMSYTSAIIDGINIGCLSNYIHSKINYQTSDWDFYFDSAMSESGDDEYGIDLHMQIATFYEWDIICVYDRLIALLKHLHLNPIEQQWKILLFFKDENHFNVTIENNIIKIQNRRDFSPLYEFDNFNDAIQHLGLNNG